MVKSKLNQCLEDHHTLPDNCFAYKRQKSTSSCLNYLFLHVFIDSHKKHVLGLSINISKTYERAKLSLFMNVMSDIKLLWHYPMDNSKFNIIHNMQLTMCGYLLSIDNVLLQGCVLCLVLFNIYTFSLHEKCSNFPIFVTGGSNPLHRPI